MIPLGGFVTSTGVGMWGILAPMGALVFGGVRAGIRWYVAFLAVFLGCGIAGEILGTVSPLPAWFTTLMLALNIAVGGTIVFTLLALFAKQRQDALTALRIAQDQAENLLLNVLPRPIAERLKAEPQTIADQFTSASILFADVVDFTRRSEQLSPAEVVGILDHLFSHFDMLAERYAVEKIKTIGDCYMVAAGVPSRGRIMPARWRSWRSTWSRPCARATGWGTSVWSCASGSIPARSWRASSAASASCTTCGATPSTPPAGWNRRGRRAGSRSPARPTS